MQPTRMEFYLHLYERRAALRESLRVIMRDKVDSICRIPGVMPDGADGYGFRSGHIEKLLRLVKVEGDPDTTDHQLKLDLLRELLGGYPVYSRCHCGQDYFVSSYEAWSKTMRKQFSVIGERLSA